MSQLPTRAGPSEGTGERRFSYRAAWTATFIAAAVLLVVIVLVAAVDGLRIAVQGQALESLKANVPVREQVYPGPVSASPTTATVTQSGVEVLVSEGSAKSTATETILRSGPGTQYAFVRYLTPGEQVQALTPPIEVQGQQWQRVRTSDGQLGWCMVHELSPLSAEE